MFQDDTYLDSALKAGDLIWEKGLLLKGFGLCHGICGNAYFLHSIYRVTKDQKWLYRAFKFASSVTDERVRSKVQSYDDPSRKEVGQPDGLYSLMEGLAGTTVMIIDMLMQDEIDPKFPGYEI